MTHPFERVLSMIDVKSRRASAVLALCPAHADHTTPSLSVREMADGRVLLKCFAGCTSAAIIAAIGLQFRDLYPHDDTVAAPHRARKPKATQDALKTAYRAALNSIIARRLAHEIDAPVRATEKSRARMIAAYQFRDLHLDAASPEDWESHRPWDADPLWPLWYADALRTLVIARVRAADPLATQEQIDSAIPTLHERSQAAEDAARGLREWSEAQRLTTDRSCGAV